ncbi:MAG: hypothetical protein ACI8W3_001162, partial [Myxococcota bacterium]
MSSAIVVFTLGPSQAPLNRSYDLVNEAEPFPQYPTLATDLVAN